MVYCTVVNVRLNTNLTVSDISDTDITNIILDATVQLNSDINVLVVREPVLFIDNTRDNYINTTNKDFYVRNWNGKYLADRNNDGNVTTSDIIFYQVLSDGTESTLTISAIDDDDCKITLSATPSVVSRCFMTYSWSRVRELDGSVDPRVKMACIFLTAAYAYAKINIGRAPTIAFGSTRIARHMDSFNIYMERYRELVAQINALQEIHSIKAENTI